LKYIYANLCNDIVADGYPNHSPFLACCFYLVSMPVSMDYGIYLFQDFGLEYIAEFPKPTNNDPYAAVSSDGNIWFERACDYIYKTTI
jgi:hypothetical protein